MFFLVFDVRSDLRTLLKPLFLMLVFSIKMFVIILIDIVRYLAFFRVFWAFRTFRSVGWHVWVIFCMITAILASYAAAHLYKWKYPFCFPFWLKLTIFAHIIAAEWSLNTFFTLCYKNKQIVHIFSLSIVFNYWS